MIHKYIIHFFFLVLFQESALLSCNWCAAYRPDRPYSYEAFFMKQYFEKCKPDHLQFISFLKTMCINAATQSLKKMIEFSGKNPKEYFHLSSEELNGKHLLEIVKTYDQLIYFINTHVIDPKTKRLLHYKAKPKNENYPFLARYLKECGSTDLYGCTLLDDLYAYSLSYIGALFNSYLLRSSLDLNDKTERMQIMNLFYSMEYLTTQLQNSPYQQRAQEAFSLWTRLFNLIEKEQKNSLNNKNDHAK